MESCRAKLRHDYLRRLAPEYYQGYAMVHWTLTVADRRIGWLGDNQHAIWREVLLHALTRYCLGAPVYCLMPDHAHLLLVGLAVESDQRRAMSFIRRNTAEIFVGVTGDWQKQAFDHVLMEKERRPRAFQNVAQYIAENPVRAELVSDARAWQFSGSVIAGWPWLDWRTPNFWERWWQIFAQKDAEATGNRRGMPRRYGDDE